MHTTNIHNIHTRAHKTALIHSESASMYHFVHTHAYIVDTNQMVATWRASYAYHSMENSSIVVAIHAVLHEVPRRLGALFTP